MPTFNEEVCSYNLSIIFKPISWLLDRSKWMANKKLVFFILPKIFKFLNLQLNYQLLSDLNLLDRALEVSVWNCGSLVGENSVIGSVHIPLRKLLDTPVNRKGIKILDGWFNLSTGLR